MARKSVMPRNHKMTPKRRAQLRRAQAISARKRRLAPNKAVVRGPGRRRTAAIHTAKVNKRGISKTHVALGIAAIGVGAIAAGQTRHHLRESALRRKHGVDFIPHTATYSHHSSNNAVRRIAATRTWKPTGKNGGHGVQHGVWLSMAHTKGAADVMTADVFGNAAVKMKLTRRQVLTHKTHVIHGGLDNVTPGITHVQIHRNFLNGRKVDTNLPKTAKGTRQATQRAIKIGHVLQAKERAAAPNRKPSSVVFHSTPHVPGNANHLRRIMRRFTG